MKRLLFAILVIAIAATSYAGKADMPKDGKGVVVQGFAPDGAKSASITVDTTINMTNDVEWQVYCADAAIYRTMATSTKSGTAHVVPADTWFGRKVNSAAPFVNFSACVGTLERQ